MATKNKVLGIIFPNMHDEAIPELTRIRTMASVPFGGRYRMIDFALSGLVAAGVEHLRCSKNKLRFPYGPRRQR